MCYMHIKLQFLKFVHILYICVTACCFVCSIVVNQLWYWYRYQLKGNLGHHNGRTNTSLWAFLKFCAHKMPNTTCNVCCFQCLHLFPGHILARILGRNNCIPFEFYCAKNYLPSIFRENLSVQWKPSGLVPVFGGSVMKPSSLVYAWIIHEDVASFLNSSGTAL